MWDWSVWDWVMWFIEYLFVCMGVGNRGQVRKPFVIPLVSYCVAQIIHNFLVRNWRDYVVALDNCLSTPLLE